MGATVSVSRALDRALEFGRMIRFSHSVFALPFALASATLAGWERLTAGRFALIVVAMVGARSAAMGFNRLADESYDARNPRTRSRELPSGRIDRLPAWLFVVLASAVFVAAAFLLGPLCGALSPLALAIIFGYSYTKRFTAFTHLFLGLALAIAPIGAWLAVRGRFDVVPILLGLGVLLWVAGFDIIYACQDVDFDRSERLRSIPARWGVGTALGIARAFHAAAVAVLGSLFLLHPLHPVYLAGIAVVAGLLVYEHSLVSASDLSRVNAAFFTVNGWIGVVYLAATLIASHLAGGGAAEVGL